MDKQTDIWCFICDSPIYEYECNCSKIDIDKVKLNRIVEKYTDKVNKGLSKTGAVISNIKDIKMENER